MGQIFLAPKVAYDLSNYNNECDHLDIQIHYIDYGHKDWATLSYQVLCPTDGFNFKVECRDDIKIIHDATFVHGASYTTNISESKDSYEFHTGQWISEGSGIQLNISL